MKASIFHVALWTVCLALFVIVQAVKCPPRCTDLFGRLEDGVQEVKIELRGGGCDGRLVYMFYLVQPVTYVHVFKYALFFLRHQPAFINFRLPCFYMPPSGIMYVDVGEALFDQDEDNFLMRKASFANNHTCLWVSCKGGCSWLFFTAEGDVSPSSARC